VSNSVIEHLSDRESQESFANEIQRLAPAYFVQTPNRRFPVEPHYLEPVIHWFPKRIQKLLVRNFTLWGILSRPSPEQVNGLIAELRLLTISQVIEFFPAAEIARERTLGLTKSIIAYRRPDSSQRREKPHSRGD
jgi:hypothetical protein